MSTKKRPLDWDGSGASGVARFRRQSADESCVVWPHDFLLRRNKNATGEQEQAMIRQQISFEDIFLCFFSGKINHMLHSHLSDCGVIQSFSCKLCVCARHGLKVSGFFAVPLASGKSPVASSHEVAHLHPLPLQN